MWDTSKEALENDEKAVEQIGKAFKEAITPIMEEVAEKIKKQKSEVANYGAG